MLRYLRYFRNLCFTLFMGLGGTSLPAFAGKVSGPSIEYQSVQRAKLKSPNSNRDATYTNLARTFVNLLAPIKVKSARLLVVPYIRLESQVLEDEYNSGARERLTWDASQFGMIFVPDYKPWSLRIFGIAARYSRMDPFVPTPPMSEWIVGTDFDEHLKSWQSETIREVRGRMIYRLRTFPADTTHLVVLYLDVDFHNGLRFSTGLPSHLVFGWESEDASSYYFAGARAASRNFPISDAGVSGWTFGYAATAFLGARWELYAPAYIQIESGVMSQNATFRENQDNETIWVGDTEFAPYAQVSLLTLFDAP